MLGIRFFSLAKNPPQAPASGGQKRVGITGGLGGTTGQNSAETVGHAPAVGASVMPLPRRAPAQLVFSGGSLRGGVGFLLW